MVHFDNRPFTDDNAYEKVLTLVRALASDHRPKFYVVPHGREAQVLIGRKAQRKLGCVLCRRVMLHVASALALRHGYDALLTGESLGQVASQTLLNLWVEEPAAQVPVLRPLIGLDKQEIITIAREIGTFDISISPGLCCTIVPSRPATRARMKEILAAEKAIGIDEIIETELEGTRLVSI
jgi:thiamine biosynthesis protein ThiI